MHPRFVVSCFWSSSLKLFKGGLKLSFSAFVKKSATKGCRLTA